jgi:hypothetical protein
VAPQASSYLYHLGFVTDFIFETIDILHHPDALIGIALFDRHELDSVSKVAKELGDIIDRCEHTDSAVLSDSRWPAVAAAAAQALEVLRKTSRH